MSSGLGTSRRDMLGTNLRTQSVSANRTTAPISAKPAMPTPLRLGTGACSLYRNTGHNELNVVIVMTQHTPPQHPEIWMQIIDRKRLQKLMVIQDVSQRELAEAIGWRSHSYLGRILRGQVSTLDVEPAVRMAHFFGVGVDDLFLAKSSSESRQIAHRLAA